MKVAAVIADIVKSRNLSDRRQLQKRMEAQLSELNSRSTDIISPYTITLGDEFQAVYKTGAGLMRDVGILMADMHPVQVRFAVGIGDLSTDLNPDSALGMDGPAFHFARDGLTWLKRYDSSVLQIFSGENELAESMLNSSLRLVQGVMAGWKGHTWIIFNGLMAGLTIQDILSTIDIKQRAVYKSVVTNSVREVLDVLNAADREIRKIAGEI